MAGRGRGRGSAFSYTAEVLGLGRGADAIPASVVQPPPTFPTPDFKPVPLETGEAYEYMLLLKQEFRGSMRDSPFFIKPLDNKKDIQRYSDKYQSHANDDQWMPDFTRLPKELDFTERKRRVPRNAGGKAKVVKKKDEKEIVKALETLEKKEEEEADPSAAKAKKGEEDEEEPELEVELSEEEEEDGNDYLTSYFDPGEDYEDHDGGDEDGPTY